MATKSCYPLETVRRSHRRLAYATAAASVLVSSTLMLPISMPWLPVAIPDRPLELQLIPSAQQEKEEKKEPEPKPADEQFADQLSSESNTANVSEVLPDPLERPAPEVDWHAALHDTIRSNDPFATTSMSPGFDEQRRVAKIRFRKSEAPVKKEIWDNVEKDQLGRTILRAGDCYRVLDDPSVTNQWEQETFGQYMVYCAPQSGGPKKLPFVAQIVERRRYLQRPEANADPGITEN